MDEFDAKSFQRTWEVQHDQKQLPFWNQRAPLFSSASAAQEPANLSGIWWRWGDTFIPWMYGEWFQEALALHQSAFLGDWSAIGKVRIEGPDALAFLSHIGVADLSTFDTGRIRHFVMCNEDGKVAAEGVLGRISDDAFFYTGGGSEWLPWRFSLGKWDADCVLNTAEMFIFELQGHASIQVLESTSSGSLRDLQFNHWMPYMVAGRTVRLLRTGISGELGYEIHGKVEDGAAIWAELLRLGEPYGVRPLGVRSQILCHIESGIATCGFDYMPATLGTGGEAATAVSGPGRPIAATYPIQTVTDLFRSPFELNWCSTKVVEHGEFVGAEALRKELAEGGPKRRLMGLVWNSEDVISVFSTLFEDDSDPAPQMDMPRRLTAEYYAVREGQDLIGCATSRVFSPKLRRVISIATIDRERASSGREVTVMWGQSALNQRRIRATIVELPFKPDNRRIDVKTLPATDVG